MPTSPPPYFFDRQTACFVSTTACVAFGLLVFCGGGCSRSSTGDSTVERAAESDADRREASTPTTSERARRNETENSRSPAARFIERTETAGVSYIHRNGEEAGHFSILETLGGGAAILDFDHDGQMDLFFTGGGRFEESNAIKGMPPALYRGVGPWMYAAVTESARVDDAPWYSHGAAVSDVDHDGFADVLVTGYGGLLLFRNQGDGTFREVARAAGLVDDAWSSSAAWGDVTGDGNPDVYVAHYVNWSFSNDPPCHGSGGQRDVCSPLRFDGVPDALFVSNGDGSFREASRELGLRDDGKGLGVIMADVNIDGDLDIYVANDTVANFLYFNDGTGQLADRALASGTGLSDAGTPDGSMGVDLGDYNLDGLPDLWVANYERESFALYRNVGNGMFLHSSQATGIAAVGSLHVGWGTLLFDFDNDGDEDAFASNGHVFQNPTTAPLRQEPFLFLNEKSRFRNVAPDAGSYLSSPHKGRGVAAGDLDDDGDVDLAISHVNEPVAILENDSTEDRNWLVVRLIGRSSAREPIGAIVTVRTEHGTQTRQKKGGGSYASTHDPRLYFGLGLAKSVEEVEIHWPSGKAQTLHDIPAGEVLTVVEPN